LTFDSVIAKTKKVQFFEIQREIRSILRLADFIVPNLLN